MQITIFSFLMSIIWSHIFILIIYLLRKTNFFVKKFGFISLMTLYIICGLRIMVPIEFHFTKVLFSQRVLNDVYQNIQLDSVGSTETSIMTMLLFIWFFVAMILVMKFIYQYHNEMKQILEYEQYENEHCKQILKKIMIDSKKQMKISVLVNKNMDTPIGVGLFKKVIILPNNQYSDSELYYILLHEYTHFLNKDLHIKMITHIFCCTFWWNPIVYLLKKDLNHILEIRCDLRVVDQFTSDKKSDYLATIISTVKKTNQSQRVKLLSTTTTLFDKNNKNQIVERFKIIAGNYDLHNKNKGRTCIYILGLTFIFLSSYSFVIQPCYSAPKEDIITDINISEIRTDNSYIIKGSDTSYALFFSNDEMIYLDEETVASMVKQGFEIMEVN